MLVRYLIPFGPRCFSIIGESPSGPRALELLDFLMTSRVCEGVNLTFLSLDFFFRFLRVCLRACTGLVSDLGVYCKLKLLTMVRALFVILPLKLLPWLLGCVGLLLRPLMVFQGHI